MRQQYLVLSILALIACSPVVGHARLYETEAQCEQRYGKPQESPSDKAIPILANATNRTYNYQSWKIRVAFLNAKVSMIQYTKSVADASSITIRDDEANAILAGEANGGKWQDKMNFDLFDQLIHPKKWLNTNCSIAYFVGANRISLVIESPEVEIFKKAQAEEKERNRKASIPKF